MLSIQSELFIILIWQEFLKNSFYKILSKFVILKTHYYYQYRIIEVEKNNNLELIFRVISLYMIKAM